MQWMSQTGADVIVANHAHTPLRCERLNNGCIGAYALGNFCFTPVSYTHLSSRDYLEKLGFKNVKLVADPAFVLMPESWDISTVLPTISGEGLLGFNISPLIKSFRNNESQVSELETAIVEFLCDVIKRTELSIVLIPHVDSIDGGDRNSDYRYRCV